MLKPEQPTCLGEIYRNLERKPEDAHDEVHGGYFRKVVVSAVGLEKVRESDDSLGIKWVWTMCGCSKGCEEMGYVRFRSGNVKTNSGGRGDMEPGKIYGVEGKTMLDCCGTLIISNLLFLKP